MQRSTDRILTTHCGYSAEDGETVVPLRAMAKLRLLAEGARLADAELGG